MQPIGLLMKEHRLIERMIRLMEKEARNLKSGKAPDTDFIEGAIDFIKVYTDRCHHGKEEDILFRDLGKKKMSSEHKAIIGQLMQEHVWGREAVGKLDAAKDRYVQGDQSAKDEIIEQMEMLVRFYPEHIEKEDKHFFLPCMEYFTEEEKRAMLQECYDFDKQLIHEKYSMIVQGFERT